MFSLRFYAILSTMLAGAVQKAEAVLAKIEQERHLSDDSAHGWTEQLLLHHGHVAKRIGPALSHPDSKVRGLAVLEIWGLAAHASYEDRLQCFECMTAALHAESDGWVLGRLSLAASSMLAIGQSGKASSALHVESAADFMSTMSQDDVRAIARHLDAVDSRRGKIALIGLLGNVRRVFQDPVRAEALMALRQAAASPAAFDPTVAKALRKAIEAQPIVWRAEEE